MTDQHFAGPGLAEVERLGWSTSGPPVLRKRMAKGSALATLAP